MFLSKTSDAIALEQLPSYILIIIVKIKVISYYIIIFDESIFEIFLFTWLELPSIFHLQKRKKYPATPPTLRLFNDYTDRKSTPIATLIELQIFLDKLVLYSTTHCNTFACRSF